MLLLALTLLMLVLTVLGCATIAVVSVIRNPVDYGITAARSLPVK